MAPEIGSLLVDESTTLLELIKALGS